MAVYMAMDPSNSISDIKGYNLYAEALVGGNGDPNGVPGYDIGTDTANNSYGYVTWDGAEDTNFETGPVAFNMDANLGTGNDTLAVTGGSESPLTFATDGSGNIGSVELRAAAQTAGQVSWSDVTVGFYQGETLEETVSAGQGPQVDTTGPDSSGTEEQIAVVTPSSTNYDHVVVSGTINMSTPDGTIPGPDDLFCQVFVMPPAPTPVTVSSVVVNGDKSSLAGVQRSMVRSIVYNFSGPVQLSAGAVSIALHPNVTVNGNSTTVGAVPSGIALTPVDPDADGFSSEWVVNFSGSGVAGGSIADGVYDITLNTDDSSLVSAESGATVESRPTDTFYRLYGDLTGVGKVTSGDLTQLSARYNNPAAYLAALDYDWNGVKIDSTSLTQFSARYNNPLAQYSGFIATI